MKHIVIIGNGISGITTARHIRKLSGFRITVISSETDHFFARTALMYVYMGHMKYENTKPYEDRFWKKNRIELFRDHVSGVDPDNKEVFLSSRKKIGYDVLVIASGSVPRTFGWPGLDLAGVSGFYSYQDLENIERFTKDISGAVIVGGGLIGVELDEMMHYAGIPTVHLVRENWYWGNILPEEEGRLVEREIRRNRIDLRLNSELSEIKGDGSGRVKAVVTGNGEMIECGFVGLATGVRPNIGWLKGSGIETKQGILVDEYLKTNFDDVYAIGDCAQFREPPPNRKPVEQVWYTGRMQGETLAQTICGNPIKYEPGIWFNSAKFFNIEYQTYGLVSNKLEENEEQFCWESDDGRKCLKLVYDRGRRNLKGANIFGMRMRHEVFDRWIREGIAVEQVVEELHRAFFDPEFTKDYTERIKHSYKTETVH